MLHTAGSLPHTLRARANPTTIVQRMIPQVSLLVFVLVCTSIAATVDLPLNPQTPFIREVLSIQHDINNREIKIQLKPVRRCFKPTFRVRLSGTSLYILDLKKVESNELVFAYPELTDAGQYFVEVIALLCTHFNPDAFVDTCLEDVSEGRNVVTLPYAFEIETQEVAQPVAQMRPRWVLTNTSKASILPTRYQKTDCYTQASGWCHTKPEDLAQHNLYEWVDKPNITEAIQDVIALSNNGKIEPVEKPFIHVCIVGDSHARDMVKYGSQLAIKDVEFSLLNTLFPQEFDVNFFHKRNCSFGIVTYGQWPGSFNTNGHPHSKTMYEAEMRKVMTRLQKYDQNWTQVFVRSVNYNALMARQTSCPPVDFRSPPLIDMYNDVLRQLAKELGVAFIDLNHIIGPMWDGAPDWIHPLARVYTAEVQWILHSALQTSLLNKRPVMLYPAELSDLGSRLVRYTDGSTVYLHRQTGEIRAFPDQHTLYTMGYEYEQVKGVLPSARQGTTLGPMLPSLIKDPNT